ncbi:MAG: toxin-antitoxin system HicB family antitoxin [Pirellulales bacterium]|nr:toxin-antitoxin system HicB family antitoxin [Pirellulales bacterium]
MSDLMSDKRQEVFNVAQELFYQAPDWVTFFREVLGLQGVVRQAFPGAEEMAAFEQTDEYAQIQAMLARLRDRSSVKAGANEPTKVITVRLPKSLHDSLRAEAHERRTSMNRLCIAKLLQVIDAELIMIEA